MNVSTFVMYPGATATITGDVLKIDANPSGAYADVYVLFGNVPGAPEPVGKYMFYANWVNVPKGAQYVDSTKINNCDWHLFDVTEAEGI